MNFAGGSTMAKNTSLFLRIGEAKNLPVKDISGSSDPYCVVKVDNELVARTATVWRSLNPFWGEEYTLHLPNGFHVLSVYVYDQDTISGDDLIGKVFLTRDMIQGAPKGVEKWLQLSPSERAREIQGEVHLQVGCYTSHAHEVVRVKVVEARDLPPKDLLGSSDPYVRAMFMDMQKQTKVIRGSRFPEWSETLEFEVPKVVDRDSETLTLTLWDWDRMGTDDFMGKVMFRLAELTPNQTFDQWFRLQPKERTINENSQKHQDTLGSIRIRARLSEERILPSQYYQPLINLLLDSISPDKHKISGPTPLKMLQEVMTLDLMEVANTLVKMYLGQGKITDYLDVVCTEEIQNTSNPNTLFRGNSLATKSVDQFMKIVGMPYLHETLGPVLEEIYEERKLVELDPGRLEVLRNSRRPSLKALPKDKDLIEQSTATLLRYLTSIRNRIFSSVARVPPVMRIVFKTLRQRIEERWPGPEHEDHKSIGISGFLFLRFFAPAILSPKLFSMQENHPDAKTSRTLTLVAKVIQNMGNLGLQLGLGKEQWMSPMHPFIKDSVKDVKSFIDRFCTIDDDQGAVGAAPKGNVPTATAVSTNNSEISIERVTFDLTRRRSVFHPSVIIKQGYIWKRRWDKIKFLNPFTFKKRYFWLRYDVLSYAKKPTDQVRNNIPMPSVCGVERVDTQAFSRKNMGQVLMRNSQGNLQILYFQARDLNDMYSWISSIRKTIITNDSVLEMYHPGTYRSDKWTCCSRTGKEASGCSPTHSRVTIGDWRDPLDPDQEAQTIYSQLHYGREMLKLRYCESQEAVRETVEETVKEIVQEERRKRSSELAPINLEPLTLETDNLNQLSPHSLTPSHSAQPQSPVFLGITNDDQHALLRHSTSFQDATIASVAQLLDVIYDLEKAHEAYAQLEQEAARHSLRGDLS